MAAWSEQCCRQAERDRADQLHHGNRRIDHLRHQGGQSSWGYPGTAVLQPVQGLNFFVNQRQRPGTGFLSLVDAGERFVARILTMITGVVIAAALIQLILLLGNKLLLGTGANWLGDDLIKVLGDLLTVLIALEVLQNITSYLRRHVVQIELVLVTALTAVARKVIVLPSGAEDKPQLLFGLGIATLSLAAAYWLVRRAIPQTRNRANAKRAREFLDQDLFSPHDDVDAAEDGDGRQR